LKNWELLLIGLAVGVPIGAIVVALLLKNPVATARATVPVQTYDNAEKWGFIRDKRGLVVGVEAKRHAEES